MLAALGGSPQNGQKPDPSDSTKPPEHTNRIAEPFQVRKVEGFIGQEGGQDGSLGGTAFEISGPWTEQRSWRTETDKHGHFSIKQVPAGGYVFTARHDGFQPVTGTIVVSSTAPKGQIDIIMRAEK